MLFRIAALAALPHESRKTENKPWPVTVAYAYMQIHTMLSRAPCDTVDVAGVTPRESSTGCDFAADDWHPAKQLSTANIRRAGKVVKELHHIKNYDIKMMSQTSACN